MSKKRVYKFNGKVSKTLNWLLPFIHEAGKMGIRVDRLKTVKAFKIAHGKLETHFADCRCHNDGTADIRILDRFQINRIINGKLVTIDYIWANEIHKTEFTLNSLAHELTHIGDVDHTVDRFIIESRLMVVFAKLAKKLNYCGY